MHKCKQKDLIGECVPEDPLMAAPWFSAVRAALGYEPIMKAFEKETGMRMPRTLTGLDRMIDQATGYDPHRHFLEKFLPWFNANVWGDPRMDHTGCVDGVRVENGQ